MNNDDKNKMNTGKGDHTRTKEELEKEKDEIETQLKRYEKVPDFGDDIDSFEEETEEAEQYSAQLGIRQAFKERLEEIETELRKFNTKE